MNNVKINKKVVGPSHPVYVIAEIGINHNGDLNIAKQLIDVAVECGCDAIKFQKRTISTVYTSDELDKYRESVFGTTNRQLKEGLEFGEEEFAEIAEHARGLAIDWFASCWDEQSVDFIEQFDPPCYKIASASLTDDKLLCHHRKYGRPIILSTGMSTLEEINHAVNVLGKDDLILMHCTSTYPSQPDELNLRVIEFLQDHYAVPIGYSGHETGLVTTIAAVVKGASCVERHITLDRSLWGSDQAASVEPLGLKRLVRDIRVIERALGDGNKRVYESELPIKEKLRRI